MSSKSKDLGNFSTPFVRFDSNLDEVFLFNTKVSRGPTTILLSATLPKFPRVWKECLEAGSHLDGFCRISANLSIDPTPLLPSRVVANFLFHVIQHELKSTALNISTSEVAIERSSESPVHAVQHELISIALSPRKNDATDEHSSTTHTFAVHYASHSKSMANTKTVRSHKDKIDRKHVELGYTLRMIAL
jgi:hypothetical protein